MSSHLVKMAEEAKEDSDSGGNSMFVTTVGLKADTELEDWIIDARTSKQITFQKETTGSLKLLKQLDSVLDAL